MELLKKYNEFIKEEVETDVAQPPIDTESTVNVDEINKLLNDLTNVVKNKIEENKKIIVDYYNKTSKDGQELNTTDEFYVYGRYMGNEKVEDANMSFKIRLGELTDKGRTFEVIEGEKLPSVKIDSKEIELAKKTTEGVVKIEPGLINGKFVVKNKEKINLIKPKQETPPEQKPVDDKESSKVLTTDKIEIKKDEEYYRIFKQGEKTIVERILIKDILPDDKFSFEILSNNEEGVFDKPLLRNQKLGNAKYYKDVNKLLDSYKMFLTNKNLKHDTIIGILNDSNKKPQKTFDLNKYYNYKTKDNKNIVIQIIDYNKKDKSYIAKLPNGTQFAITSDLVKNIGKEVLPPSPDKQEKTDKSENIKVGDKIEYDNKQGEVIRIEGEGDNKSYIVDYGDDQEHRILDKFAKNIKVIK